MLDLLELKAYLRSSLSLKRYLHSLRTAHLCADLASKFGVSVQEAWIAGLSHDMARELSYPEIFELAEQDDYEILPEDLRHPILLHGRAAAVRLQRDWGEERSSILQAVRWHTQGHPEMGVLGMLLFVSDYCELGRAHISDEFREEIFSKKSHNEMVLMIIEDHKAHLQEKQKHLSQHTDELIRLVREGQYANA